MKAGSLSETTSIPLVRGVDWWRILFRAARPCMPRGIDTISGTLWACLSQPARSYYVIGKELTLLACRVRQIGFFWCNSFSCAASYHLFAESKCSLLKPCLCLPWLAVTMLAVQPILCCTESSLLREGCDHSRIDSHLVGTLGRTSSSIKSIWFQLLITLKPRSWHLSTGTVDFKPQHTHTHTLP